jgi:ribosomal protein L7/L12
MRVRIWNAYASNNSGSYTIVGRLPSEEVAREVAAELKRVIDEHTAWREAWSGNGDCGDSPLAAFCRTHGLSWKPGMGGWDDWPEHSGDNHPRVAAIGHQVIVHHQYTVSLPPVLGELFYRRGGRVDHEENHAHHPLVAVATYWWGWHEDDRACMELERPKLVETLAGEGGVLAEVPLDGWPAAWHEGGDDFGAAPLTVGAIFAELVSGVEALRQAGERHGAKMELRVVEAADDAHDPLSHLRPSTPPRARFDVMIDEVGENRPQVVEALREAVGLYEVEARRRLMDLPSVIVRSATQPRAEAAAERLRRAGATVRVPRNDG